VVQTTQPVKALQELVTALLPLVSELKVHNTICGSTSQRQAETKEIARQVDVMVVVGGKNSANTKQLARLSEALGIRTYHIETVEELSPEMFKGANKVGVTAGASTAQWLIDEVVEFLKGL
jgi:4-hydroxy-3-methylbut-2-enyl diphosphate reductase